MLFYILGRLHPACVVRRYTEVPKNPVKLQFFVGGVKAVIAFLQKCRNFSNITKICEINIGKDALLQEFG